MFRRRTVFLLSVTAGLLTGLIAGVAAASPQGTTDGPDLESNVVGGQPAPAGKWPDAVALISDGFGFCTGTLIAPDVVLTAAHCVGEGVQSVKIDATSSTGGGEDIDVAEVHTYSNWETTFDVAVLVLAGTSQTTPRQVATSCVTSRFLTEGASVKLVGYGATDIQGMTQNTQLREATAAVMDPDCSNGDGCQPAVAPGGEMTAGGSTVNSCFGDSGGPVYLPTAEGTFLAGVVSRGVDSLTAPCQGGGIYVRPDAVLEWVEEVSGKQIARPACDGAPDGEDPDADDDDGDGDGDDGDDGDGSAGGAGDDAQVVGGCSTGGGSGGLAAIGLVAAIGLRRRRPARR